MRVLLEPTGGSPIRTDQPGGEGFSAVRSAPLFPGQSDGTLARLTERARLERFSAGQAIVRQGERPAFLHVALDGLVELWASHNGIETTMRLAEPGDPFILACGLFRFNRAWLSGDKTRKSIPDGIRMETTSE